AGLTTSCGHGFSVATTVDGTEPRGARGSGSGGGCPRASSTARSAARTRETVGTSFCQREANGQGGDGHTPCQGDRRKGTGGGEPICGRFAAEKRNPRRPAGG